MKMHQVLLHTGKYTMVKTGKLVNGVKQYS